MSQSHVAYRSIPISIDQSPGDFEAIALYDNQSESSDELNFKKGDILKILERDFHGIAGWWLCALRDKIGLAPGNRLEIIGNTPEKPQNFRTSDNNHVGVTELTKGKMDGEISKLAYGLYDVPKIVYDLQPSSQQQQETEKQNEIPDILKDQTVNAHSGSNSNQILYTGLAKSPPLEEITIQKDHVYNKGPDAYVRPDDLSLVPNGKKNSYNSSSVNNGSLSSGKGPLENVQSAPWTGSSQKASPSMNVSTYSNLQQQPSSLSPVGNAELKHQPLVYQVPVNKRIIYSDSDNYDNLCTPPAVLVNGQSRAAKENSAIVATTNNNMNKNANGFGKSNGNVQYYDSRDPYRFLGVNGSQTLQHRPRRSEECRIVARDDTDLQMKYKNDAKGKRDRSLRRVRFADQVTSSDTEEWAKNSDPIPNQNAVPLKPILSSSLSKSSSYCNSNNSQSVSSRNNNSNNNNNHNNDNGLLSSTSDFANKQNNQVFYQEDVPDYENPYSEIADQPIYEKPPIAYISTSSKLNVDNQNGKPGKCYTSEFTTVLNTRDAGSNPQGENGNNTLPYYKNHVGSKQIHPSSLPKMFEGVYISPPDYGNLIENEPEFQLHFVDLPKKEQDKIPKSDDGSPKLSPELLNKSREKIQILANSMDGILNRKNAEDVEIATVILKSIDVELQFLVSVGEKGLKKSIETWSEDLIETLLQHLEDLRTIQGTLALLNKQILELSRDKSNVQHCQTFETICSSCALSARNICYPVHQFVTYLLPKFKFLFPISLNDIGRLAPSPTFNNNPSSYSTMTRNQLKGKIPDNPGYSSLGVAQGLNVPRNVPIGRVPSPIPKIESVPPYNGNNVSREAAYYDDIPYNLTMRQMTPNDLGTSNKFDNRHLGSNQILESRINPANGGIKPGPSYSTLPSQALQARPLPPAPPSYSSVVGQLSYVPQQKMPLPNTQIPPANFSRFQISPRNSPVLNNHIYSGINSYNNDSA